MSKEPKRPGYFIRPNTLDAEGAMEGKFELEGIACILRLHADKTVSVHRISDKTGAPLKAPIAQGVLSRNPVSRNNPDAPWLVGDISTKAGSEFELAFWRHMDVKDPSSSFFVAKYSTRIKRQGKFFAFDD